MSNCGSLQRRHLSGFIVLSIAAMLWYTSYAQAEDRVIDVSKGVTFHRGVIGTTGNGRVWRTDGWDWEKHLTEFERTSVRGVAGGDFATSYNWKNLVGISMIDRPSIYSWDRDPNSFNGGQSTLEFLRACRDWNAEFIMTVNTTGVGRFVKPSRDVSEDNFQYTETSVEFVSALAGDWVRYTNQIVQKYRQGDLIKDSTDNRILKEIDWSRSDFRKDKLLAPYETPVQKVIYWEIGNEVEWSFRDPNTRKPDGTKYDDIYSGGKERYRQRYAALTKAMLAQDPGIKVGPCVTGGWPQTNYILSPILNDQALKVDFVAYHPYIGDITKIKLSDHNGVTLILNQLKHGYEIHKEEITKTIIGSGRDPSKVELLATEYNPAVTNLYWHERQYNALAIADSIFSFAQLGLTTANLWMGACDYHNGNEFPQYKALRAMLKYMGDNIVDSYSEKDFRLYVTKDSVDGTIAVWGLNFKFGDPTDTARKMRLTLKGIPYEPANVTLMRLKDLKGPTNMLSGVPDDKIAATDRESSYSAGASTVDWACEDKTGMKFSNFEFDVEPAQITLLVIQKNGQRVN